MKLFQLAVQGEHCHSEAENAVIVRLRGEVLPFFLALVVDFPGCTQGGDAALADHCSL